MYRGVPHTWPSGGAANKLLVFFENKVELKVACLPQGVRTVENKVEMVLARVRLFAIPFCQRSALIGPLKWGLGEGMVDFFLALAYFWKSGFTIYTAWRLITWMIQRGLSAQLQCLCKVSGRKVIFLAWFITTHRLRAWGLEGYADWEVDCDPTIGQLTDGLSCQEGIETELGWKESMVFGPGSHYHLCMCEVAML